jgi:hypothetical protein
MLVERTSADLFADLGPHGKNQKMSITLTLTEWNEIIDHLQNSQKYLEDRSRGSGFWAGWMASFIDDKLEKKIIKLN